MKRIRGLSHRSPWYQRKEISHSASSSTAVLESSRLLSTTTSSSSFSSHAPENHNVIKRDTMARSFQEILQMRRTATRLTPSSSSEQLTQALDRAVQCAMMAPNHKRTEPFSFLRILRGSQTAQRLADIAHQIALKKSPQVAEKKRQKWMEIPAFMITIIHDNADYYDYYDNDPYQILEYSPPDTEQKLEDYASASCAVQNILLSLHAEGFGSKWATGPVINTPAFRLLIKAKPTDRIGALIMVGGTTEFSSEREKEVVTTRRHRRRSFKGDVLNDLP